MRDPRSPNPSSPETFSSELGGLDERARPPSFNEEFRGLSDTEIQRSDRPERSRGRLGKLLAIVLGSSLAVAGIATGVYFGLEALGQRREATAAVEPSEAPASPEPASSEPTPASPQPSDPWAETPPLPSGGESLPWPPPSWDRPTPSEPTPSEPTPSEPTPTPTPTPTPSEPTPTPTPTPTPSDAKASATLLDGSTRGQISGLTTRLSAIDDAVTRCWTDAVARGERGEHTLALAFTIRWNRKAVGVRASGEGTSTTLRECVEKSVPRSGWPEPRDMGDAHVARRWTLRG